MNFRKASLYQLSLVKCPSHSDKKQILFLNLYDLIFVESQVFYFTGIANLQVYVPDLKMLSRYLVEASLTVFRLNSAEVPPITMARWYGGQAAVPKVCRQVHVHEIKF